MLCGYALGDYIRMRRLTLAAEELMRTNDKVIDMVGKIGEKIEITSYEVIEAPKVAIYIHPGNKVVSMVGMSSATAPAEAGKDVAMQIAAMNPLAVDENSIPADVIAREKDIAIEVVKAEGKPAEMAEKIAMGKLNKFFKDNNISGVFAVE